MARLLVLTTRRLRVYLSFALVAGGFAAGPAQAQASVSQPVGQAGPSAALGDLNAALRDLARNPGNVSALLRAGWDSIAIDDTQSALGFFRRAAALQPQNGEVKAGLASVSLHMADPVNAVRLFAEAEAAGAPMARYAGDRGLALDLVGNNAGAQQLYRQALAQANDPEIVRRLALSQAIAGDQNGSDATLLPLLQRRDLAAYRTRAFALAILGQGEQAVSIAQTMLPPQISSRLAPYLRYMPRLTRAQQAAAANLGQFPPAAEIGRDSPQIAVFSGAGPAKVASAAPDSRLVPSGEPLGPSSRQVANSRDARSERSKRKGRKSKGSLEVTYAPLAQAAPQPAPAVSPQQAATQLSASAPVQRVAELPAIAPPQQAQVATTPPPVTRVAAAVQASAILPAEEKRSESQPVLVARIDPPPSSSPPAPPIEQAPPPPSSSPPAPSIEQAPAPSSSPSVPPVEQALPRSTSPASPALQQPSLAEAFADFTKPPLAATKPADAIDISQLKPAREPAKNEPKADLAKSKADAAKARADAAKAKAKPKPPANPSRIWVQVATGRNVTALGFDWRRLQKEGGALLARHDAYTTKWGATRRLLTGPYKTEAEADKAVAALKKKGIDAFEFTSDEGQDVAPLK